MPNLLKPLVLPPVVVARDGRPKVFWSPWVETRVSGKQNVEKKRQLAMLVYPPMVGERPKVADLYWELKNARQKHR